MHIHILGVGEAFMRGVALLARAQGHTVSGADNEVDSPAYDGLRAQGIALIPGWDPAQLNPQPDQLLIGTTVSRGNPCVEAALNRGLRYTSGPQWLHDELLQDRWVIAVAGAPANARTAAMTVWILEQCGYQPGFLLSDVPDSFTVPARLGYSPFFVLETDARASAFFDRRGRVMHSCPRTLILNTVPGDDGKDGDDPMPGASQLHDLLSLVPGQGRIISPAHDVALQRLLTQNCRSERETVGDWQVTAQDMTASHWQVSHQGQPVGTVSWTLSGEHAMHSGLLAIAAARHVGVLPADACAALTQFNDRAAPQ